MKFPLHFILNLFLLIIIQQVLLKQQAHGYTNVYSTKHTVKSFAFSHDGLSLYFASQDNSIRKLEEKHHHHIQAVACDPLAYSGYSGDDNDAMMAGCTLSNSQGTLQVSNNNVYFVNGFALRMVDGQSGQIKTILEDDISSMYINDYLEIIYSSGNSIKKRNSNGFVQILAGGIECKGEQDGLSIEESCVYPSHIVQDESYQGEIYFYDEKLRMIRKIENDKITTIAGTSGHSVFDVRNGIIYCSDGKLIKKIHHDGGFEIIAYSYVDETDGKFNDLQVTMIKISPEWEEDEIYFLTVNGDLKKIDNHGKLSTLVSKSNYKPKFYRKRTILAEFEYKGNNGTNGTLPGNNSTMNGTVNNSTNFGNNTFGNNTNNNNGNYSNGNYTNGNYTNGNYTNGNFTNGNNTNGNTQPIDNKFNYYPTPILRSEISQDGSGIRFFITFGKSNLYSHRVFYVQDSNYDTTLCRNTYYDRLIPIKLVEFSDVMLTQNYTTNYIPLANLINNPSVDKKLTADYLQLTINLAMEYIDDFGEFNGGFCRAYIYKTSQNINVVYSTTIVSSLSASNLLDYSYKMYPQLVTSDSNSGAGSLIVEMMLEASNLTLLQFSYHNSTNPNCDFFISSVAYQFQTDSKKYWKIAMTTITKAYDFTGTTLFSAKFESNRGYVFNDYIPLAIDYKIAIPPDEQNTTVKYSLSLSGSDLSPKTSFNIGDSLFVRLNAYNSYGTYKLRAKSAFLCCMKQFSPAPIYDPTNNLFGCSTYDSSTMDVWKPLFTGFVPNSQMEISEFPTPDTIHIFNFKLKFEYFPARDSKSYTAACYIQTTGALRDQNSRKIHTGSYPETEVQSLSVVIPESTQPTPEGSTKVVSSGSLLTSCYLVILSVLFVYFTI